MHDFSDGGAANIAQLRDRRGPTRPVLAATTPTHATAPPLLSIVTPAYNEARNLGGLHARLAATLDPLGIDWEWVIVDDHSNDDTFATICRLRAKDPRIRGVRFAHNFGSH